MAATIKEIAKIANVSPKTVSLVLNGKLKGKRRDAFERSQRIRKIAKDLDYRPNAAARAARGQSTRQIGVILPNTADRPFHNPATFETITGINTGLQEAGYILCMTRVDDLMDSLHDNRLLQEHVVDGFIIVDRAPRDIELHLEDHPQPCVWVDSNIYRHNNCLRRDEIATGKLAAENAIAKGYKRLLYFTYPEDQAATHHSHDARKRGILEAMMDHPGADIEFLTYDPSNIDLNEITPSTAVIATNQALTMRLMNRLMKKRLIPGDDYGLVVLDSTRSWMTSWPDCARVTYDRYEFGKRAATMILSTLAGEPTLSQTIAGAWIEGSSLGQAS